MNAMYKYCDVTSLCLRGLQLESVNGEHRLKVAGYADDTALFL